jgi:hypothetical protein|tara:strand:- start:239 stop:463 length:225 start_codon:yes stop_codon:yes gene_type:complete
MKLNPQEVVESIARLSDDDKREFANIFVNKWSHLAKSVVGMIDAEIQDKDRDNNFMMDLYEGKLPDMEFLKIKK